MWIYKKGDSMRQTFKLVLDKLNGFSMGMMIILKLKDNSLTAMIEQAIQKDGCSYHTCWNKFSGDIVKHDVYSPTNYRQKFFKT